MALLSNAASPEKHGRGIVDESRREALGRFLRERREALAPKQAGIASHRGRRTPGLRREEVAFLADIGVKWYARLEAGDDVHPSTATLTGIATALQLSNAELEYMLALAGLHQPSVDRVNVTALPDPLTALVGSMRGVAATLADRILTPILWNYIADGMYGHSRYADPIDRNGLVRSLLDPDFIAFLGSEREELVAHAVGMFRMNYSSPSPSPFAADVYARVKDEALFQAAWQRRIVASELTGATVTIRQHRIVGRLAIYAIDLISAMQTSLIVRVMMPADEETERKFRQLEELGRASADGVGRLRYG